MGKRSDFVRKPRDFYPTPFQAVVPLAEQFKGEFTFAEPCAGDGQLCRHLEYFGGVCMWASDIFPKGDSIIEKDFKEVEVEEAEYIITNPPWDRKILYTLIEHFSLQRPTWLLFDADWVHTKQSVPYIKYLHKIVSVGRIKWFGNMTGKDNCAWHLFDKKSSQTTEFFGRSL